MLLHFCLAQNALLCFESGLECVGLVTSPERVVERVRLCLVFLSFILLG